ncbi:MAG: DUF1223 domain-containing protein [Arcobacter sp.]|nr:DUF1223 domain-containing protein [Arcobacter sp.]
MNNIFLKTTLILFLVVNISFSKEFKFNSGENKINVIELYTSEGCSSCPVAEKWISNLKYNNNVFKEFIPMSFHVTYWDFLGWKDSFADIMYDTRQRYYAIKIWKNKSIYTPQFVVDAKEYRKWFTNQDIPKFTKEYGGNLVFTINNSNLKVDYFNKNIKNKKVYLNIALLGFDYKINIKSGENKRRVLEHDFVVLDHIQKFAEIKNNRLIYNMNYIMNKDKKRKYALVAWINSYDTKILQASGGYIKYN